jgi:hypothetical protein
MIDNPSWEMSSTIAWSSSSLAKDVLFGRLFNQRRGNELGELVGGIDEGEKDDLRDPFTKKFMWRAKA